MFTGIVTAIGTITKVENKGDLRVVVSCPWDPAGMDIGASIACSGVCLTVVEKGGEPGDAFFAVDVSGETISRTPQDQWRADRRLNIGSISNTAQLSCGGGGGPAPREFIPV